MFSITRWRTLGVGACCAVAGIGAGAVATAGASSSSRSSGDAHHAKAHHGWARHGGLRSVTRRSVHGEAVVRTNAGYRTVTWDRGIVRSVSGDAITLAEGGTAHPYKTVTVTVPSDVHVRDNRQTASLSSLSAGQRAVVVQAPKRTVVIARTPKARR